MSTTVKLVSAWIFDSQLMLDDCNIQCKTNFTTEQFYTAVQRKAGLTA